MNSHPTSTPGRPVRGIALTGFMGSGKSTVGRLLATRLGWRFADADDAIEQQSGMAIADIFARFGEPEFRLREQRVIAQLAALEHTVIALGGGAIESEATRRLLLETPHRMLINLEVSLQTALARCSGTEATRPVLADRAALESRYQRRLPLYRQAHFNLPVDSLSPEDVVEQIVHAAGL